MATAGDVLQQIKRLFLDLSARQKFITGSILLLVLAGFGLIFLMTNQITYRTLYTDLTPEAASEIIAWLKNEGVPCKLAPGGDAVQVPAERMHETRLALAGAGLPKGSGVGFEVFDQTALGVTDFAQQVNYQRALQGELERTIARFPQVASARVHIAQPKESLFVNERREPTASVVLRLKPGEGLTSTQVRAITHLVASAVPRLKEENVSLVDTTGEVLSREPDAGDSLAALTTGQLVYQRRLEDYYRQKIQGMLQDALGPERAVARVSADIDFDQIQINEDRYDPDMVAVRSEQKTIETVRDEEKGGIPGVKGGLADKIQGNAGLQATGVVTQREHDTTNFEITRLQRQVNGALGKLKRLSVGVLVDGTYKQNGGETVYVPRTPEEMTDLEQIVKAAIGFSLERGDDVSVVNVAFHERAAGVDAMSRMVDVGSRFFKPLANLLLALLFIFLVLRPLLNRYVFKPETAESGLPALHTGEPTALEQRAGPAVEKLPPLEPLPDVKQELREVADSYPERAAALVKVWLREKMDSEKKPERQPAKA